MKHKANHLLLSENKILADWARDVNKMFTDGGHGPYLVGSVMTTKNYRDVDLRTILADDMFDVLKNVIDIDRLNLGISLWGQRVTGLPIDYQVQRMTEANIEFEGKRRNAIWITAP